jgi:hypothetical protein
MIVKMANQRFSKKIFNICMVFIIIVIILFVATMLILNYDVNGETNMPFQVSKISIISTVDGKDVENSDYKWGIDVIQNNDIYVYIEKNNGYSKQETIKSVTLDEFNIEQSPTKGKIKIYKPVVNQTSLFQNLDENIIDKLEFVGAKSTDTRNLEISNQGGVICFRCANNDIGTYNSNDDEEIQYNELIKKLNISEEDLTAKLSFNITITLNSGKVFKAEDVEITIPNENIVEEGTVGQEYTDLENIVFKRIEN